VIEENGANPASASNSRAAGWEQDLLERLAFAAIDEQRKARRWGIFFKFLFVFWLLLAIILLLSQADNFGGKALASRYSALVELEGIIEPDGPASADNVISGLRAAFADEAAAGVIIRANSPGGSPVQSAYINDEIQRLRKLHPKTPVYAVIGDVCASGCYYAVVAADKIYADESSIVGSIGVLMNGFGFVDSLKKLGVERRLLTAGEHKGILDPFSPTTAFDRRHAQTMLDQIHKQFVARVRAGRGEALKESEAIFSGLFWTGEDALQLGLIDAIGSASYVAREVIGAEDIVDFTFHERFFDRFARRIGSAMVGSLESRLWSSAPSLR
jgi:protease-4